MMTAWLPETGTLRGAKPKTFDASGVSAIDSLRRGSIPETQLAGLLPLFEEVVAARIVSDCRKQPDNVWKWGDAGKLVMAMTAVFDESLTPASVKKLVVITVRAICQIVPTGQCDLT